MPYTYDYPRPMLCVDMLILRKDRNKTELLLIKRRNEPFKNHWALPGGFIEMEEDLIESAHRELEEETKITKVNLIQLKTYGKPGRDPRGRTISVVFGGFLEDVQEAKAGDDAKKAEWFPINDLPELAFDHKIITDDSLKMMLNDSIR